jgi:hypothetical protein
MGDSSSPLVTINTAKALRSGIKCEYFSGDLFALLTNALFPSHGSVILH